MNINSLSHPVTQARIYAAMRYAVNASNGMYSKRNLDKLSCVSTQGIANVFIKNKKGEDFLCVTYARATNGNPSGFRFYGAGGECTQAVLKSLRNF